MKHVIFTHAHCADGAAAALAMWTYLTGVDGQDAVEVVPCRYGDGRHLRVDVAGARVYMVDYSVPVPDLVALAAQAVHVLVLDHHRTAQQTLAADLRWKPVNVDVRFDMERSGAVLAWAWTQEQRVLAGEEPVHGMPALYAYVQDRDLWHFRLPHSRAVNAYIANGTLEVQRFAGLLHELATDMERVQAVGQALDVYQQTLAHAAAATAARAVCADGTPFALINAAAVMSEVGHAALEMYAWASFACIYTDDGARGVRRVSLRSRGLVDVSAIAQRLGGGGHAQAAGFELSINQPVSI